MPPKMEHPKECPECRRTFASDPQWLLNGHPACNYCAYTKGNERFHKITYGITLGAIGATIIYFTSKIPNDVVQSFFPKADDRLKNFFLCGFGMVATIAFIFFFIPSLSITKKTLERISPFTKTENSPSRPSCSGFHLALLTIGSACTGLAADLLIYSKAFLSAIAAAITCVFITTGITTFLVLQKKIQITDDFYFSLTTPKKNEPPQGEDQCDSSPRISPRNAEFAVIVGAFLFGSLFISNYLIPVLFQGAYLWIVRPTMALSNTLASTERSPGENIQITVLFALQRLGPAILIYLILLLFFQNRQTLAL